MKLLGWVHRKFRQNSSEQLKNFALGQPPLHEQYYSPKPTNGVKPYSRNQRDHYLKSFAGIEATQTEEEDHEEEASATMSELFHGFLAIGTLGSDTNISAPSTPTFSISLLNKTDKETEATERELKLLNDNLEKILGAEVKEESCDVSSGRNSHVSISTGRSSHGSTITLSGKTLEIPETNRNGSTVCPLQEYLFGSAVELSETTETAKKEQRTSLRELFQKTKIAEENTGGRCEREEKQTEKDADKSAVNIMKKMLKKKVPHVSRSSTTAFGRTANSASVETKMNKILHMFHRKVHPESSTTSKKNVKLLRNEKDGVISYGGVHNNEGQIFPGDEITLLPQNVVSQKGIRCYKSQSNPQFTLSSESNGNREFWIKTDADYLVLEL